VPKIHSCGEQVTYAAVPGRPGKYVTLAAYPDMEGTVRVDVLARGRLILLDPDQPGSARTKRYERHRCVERGVRAPGKRAQQLTIGDT
jgi:hypothetical protein